MKPKISICKKMCIECGFAPKSIDNTLYQETLEYLLKGIIFPCHMELKKVTGSENQGVEKLKEIKVCRGYVIFAKKYRPELYVLNNTWKWLFDQINDTEFDDIVTMTELFQKHSKTIIRSLNE